MELHRMAWVVGLAILPLSACMPGAQVERSTPEQGAVLFQQNCAICHGADGRGQGEVPDLTRLERGPDREFPTIDVLAQIHEGGGGMPSFDRFVASPTVVVEIEEGIGTPVPADLLALWEYLETIQRRG